MKSTRIVGLMLLALFGVMGIGLVMHAALAQGLETKVENGHIAPVMIEATYLSGSKKTGMLLAHSDIQSSSSYNWSGRQRKGGGDITIYLDSLSSISEIDGQYGTYTFKDGTTERADLSPYFAIVTPNDARERLDWKGVKEVKFLGGTRKDKEGNAMFPHWRYSPYTGEKLPTE